MGWTAYPEIDAALALLLSGSRAILREKFFGMYVFGSLASGGFDEETSDIDFVVITTVAVDAATQARLADLNCTLQASGSRWAAKLEGSFLPIHAFKDFNPTSKAYPTIGMGGCFGLDHKGIERAIQRSLLREDGLTLAGPEPSTFIDPVGADDLRQEARDILHGWWKPHLGDPTRFRRRGYQAYAVLTMCRMLYTLDSGRIASKPAAAAWARRMLPERWCGLIDRALHWKASDGVDDLTATLELMRYTLGRDGPSGTAP